MLADLDHAEAYIVLIGIICVADFLQQSCADLCTWPVAGVVDKGGDPGLVDEKEAIAGDNQDVTVEKVDRLVPTINLRHDRAEQDRGYTVAVRVLVGLPLRYQPVHHHPVQPAGHRMFLVEARHPIAAQQIKRRVANRDPVKPVANDQRGDQSCAHAAPVGPVGGVVGNLAVRAIHRITQDRPDVAFKKGCVIGVKPQFVEDLLHDDPAGNVACGVPPHTIGQNDVTQA